MRRAVAVAALVVLLAACGTPQGPVTIPQEEIPFPIKRSAEPPRPGRVTKPFVISFVRRGRLVGVRRDLNTQLPEAEAAMRSLLGGPNDGDIERGITTEIPTDTRLLTIRTVDKVAEVDLSGEFQQPGPSARVLLRVAQVVRTLVMLRSVDAVRFAINGETIGVPTDQGPVVRPVTILDYASVTRRES